MKTQICVGLGNWYGYGVVSKVTITSI